MVYGLGVPKIGRLPRDLVVQVSNGRNEQRYRRHRDVRLSEYLARPSQLLLEGGRGLPTIFLSDLLTELQRRVWRRLSLPQLMANFTARPILSIGVEHSGEDFHAHEETWLWLAQGRKAWWFSEADVDSLRHQDPCAMSTVPELLYCVQEPGEVVFFGAQAHATCNLEPVVLGVGAQGRGVAPALAGRSLHAAAVWGHVKLARQLLESGAERDAEAALHLAALHSHVKLVKLLGGAGGVLPRAASQGHVAVMELLLRGSERAEKEAALQAAAKGGHLEAVDLMLKRQASLESRSPQEGLTALHFAASMGHVEMVRHLLRLGADPKAKDERQLLPIHLAVHADSGLVLQELLEWRPDGLPHFAAEGGRLVALKALLPEGLEATDLRGFRPLHLAALAGHREAIQLLLDRRAHVAASDPHGFTALHFAAKAGHLAAVRLLAPGAPVRGAREIAGRVGHHRVVELLEEL